MADMSDAAAALVLEIAAVVYPNGTGAASITGDAIRVYPGWPDAASLPASLASGTVHVSVYPLPTTTLTSVLMGDAEWQETANDGTSGTVARETRRQTQQFQVTVWASCFDHRDAVAAAVDAGLSAITRITLADGSRAPLCFVRSVQNDDGQKSGVYRRDMVFSVNFATIQSLAAYAITSIETDIQIQIDAGDGPVDIGPITTVTSP
jgi:hypothetical protein